MRSIGFERWHQRRGSKVRCERIGQPQRGRELGTEQTRPKNPQGDVESRARHRAHVLPGYDVLKVMLQLGDITRKLIHVSRQSAS